MDPEACRMMEMAALGRPFSLGSLYDCRTDSLIHGLTLWDSYSLERVTLERPLSSSDFEIVASESIEDKFSALNVDASLKASFFGELVEVEGSAKYLNYHKTSKNQARVTLKFKATTKFQELSMNHLGMGKVKYPDVFDKGLATHVVTGILYGAQAFFVFDREVSERENYQDVEANLKVMIKKIPWLAVEGEGSLKMEDQDRAMVEKFSCRFFGDFSLQRTPASFQDAIEVYQSLPKLLVANRQNAVPMKVFLLPLTTLDSSATKIVRQISIRLVQESQSVLEDFNELEMRCNDALKTTTAQQFSQIVKKIKDFQKTCSEFKLEFQRTLAEKLPLIRGGGEEEAVLAEILKKRHSSLYNSKDLNEWMNCKEREISILKAFTNTSIVPSQNGPFKGILSSEQGQHYSLGSDLEGSEKQPPCAPFFGKRVPTRSTQEMTLMVQDPDRTHVWQHGLHLPASSSHASPHENLPRTRKDASAEEKLRRARSPFIHRVSDPMLKKLLDELLRCRVLNDAEDEAVRAKPRADKARDVIDMVRKKGAEASSVMITILTIEDPFLCKELGLT